MYVFTKP